MSHFVVRAQSAWLASSVAVKVIALVALLALLMVLAAVPAFAGESEPNPFRWRM